jgi:hypothetical protein
VLPLDLVHALQAAQGVEQLHGPVAGWQLDHQHDPAAVAGALPLQAAQRQLLAPHDLHDLLHVEPGAGREHVLLA